MKLQLPAFYACSAWGFDPEGAAVGDLEAGVIGVFADIGDERDVGADLVYLEVFEGKGGVNGHRGEIYDLVSAVRAAGSAELKKVRREDLVHVLVIKARRLFP